MSRWDDDEEHDKSKDPTEGVRIIGAEEAEKALERGDISPRRAEGEPRFGDRPAPPPEGPGRARPRPPPGPRPPGGGGAAPLPRRADRRGSRGRRRGPRRVVELR